MPPDAGATSYNALTFVMQQLLARVQTAAIVRVTAVTPGGHGPVGRVDVQPLVNQVDAAGNATPHEAIPNLLYFRLQGGANAIIIDPTVGDTGIAVFCSRDSSKVKASGDQANPGSRRRFSWSDGIYFGICLGGDAPTQLVEFLAGGINITTPGTLTLNAGQVVINGPITHTGTFWSNGKDIGSDHRHTGVTTGTGNTGVPA